MLFVGKGKSKKFVSTKALPPDKKSLKMKIMRANFVCQSWGNCLNRLYEPFNPLNYGWIYKNELLQPEWYEGAALPTDEYIDEQIRAESMVFEYPENQEYDNDSDTSEDDYDQISELDSSSDSDF